MATTKTAPAKKAAPKTKPLVAKAANEMRHLRGVQAGTAKTMPAEPEKAPAEMPKGYKMPKTLAQVADMLYETRAKRYEINAQATVLEKVEACLRERLINELPKSNATGIRGKVANVKVESKTVPKLADFDALVGYIAKEHKKNPGIAALIQRRVNDATVKEMWAAGKSIPGVEPLDVPVVSCTKAG